MSFGSVAKLLESRGRPRFWGLSKNELPDPVTLLPWPAFFQCDERMVTVRTASGPDKNGE